MKYNGGGTRVAANAMARFVLTDRSTFAAGGGARAGHLLWRFQIVVPSFPTAHGYLH